MKLIRLRAPQALLCVLSQPLLSTASRGNPVDKTVGLLSDLQESIVRDGEEEQKAFKEYYSWCDNAEGETRNEIQTVKALKEKLTAVIERASSDVENADTKIEELTASISQDEAKLTEATAVRQTAKSDFEASEKELAESVSMLRRAAGILEKEMQSGASFAQGGTGSENLQDVLLGLSSVVDAAGFLGEDDKQKLVALVQSSMDAEDAEDAGAPAAAAYKGHSDSIISTMEDLRDKAEAQLNKERQEESKDKNNFDLLEQALKNSVADDGKRLAAQKSGQAEATEAKAKAEGELSVVTKNLAATMGRRSEIQHDCMEKASDHETTMAGRKEELAVLAKAKKIIQETTGGASSEMYGDKDSAFLQLSARSRLSLRESAGLTGGQIFGMVQKLAKEHRSAKLAQLASRIHATLEYGAAAGSDPLAKVKGLISDMIAKLEGEASEEAQEKEYCDGELAKTKDQKEDLESHIDGLKAQVDEAAAQSAALKEEVKNTQAELAELAQLMVGMDKARRDSHAAYTQAKKHLEQGLEGVRRAIGVLRDYYAQPEAEVEAPSFLQSGARQPAPPQGHRRVQGAGDGIIALLEVIESDLAKNLTEEEAEESASQDEYESESQANEVTKAIKSQDVSLKTSEFKSIDKMISQHSGDLETASTELAAVLDYYAKLNERCIAQPDAYEERKKRRDAEVQGLQQALAILEGQLALVQRRRASNR